MDNKCESLNKLDNTKLIDIVKNYKQYGYETIIRDTALKILSSRGIDEETLKLSGNFSNVAYENSDNIYNAFTKNSRLAILFFVTTLLTQISASIMVRESETIAGILLAMFYISIALYFVFLIISHFKQNEFYKSIRKPKESREQLGFFIIGMPMFILLYFYFRRKMKEDLSMLD